MRLIAGKYSMKVLCSLIDLYLHVHTMLRCAHEQKAQGVRLIGVANKKTVLWHLWALPKHNGASFSTISTVWLCLRVAQVPRSWDLVIFVLTNRQTNRTNCFYPLLCMHAWGKYSRHDDETAWFVISIKIIATRDKFIAINSLVASKGQITCTCMTVNSHPITSLCRKYSRWDIQ